jgi:hypothetical protein
MQENNKIQRKIGNKPLEKAAKKSIFGTIQIKITFTNKLREH